MSNSGRSTYVPPTFNANYNAPSSPFSPSKTVATPSLRSYEGSFKQVDEKSGHRNLLFTTIFLVHLAAFFGVSMYYLHRFHREVPAGQFAWGLHLWDTVVCIGGTAGSSAAAGATFAFLWLRFSYHAHSTRGRFVVFSVVATLIVYAATLIYMLVQHQITVAPVLLGLVIVGVLLFTALKYKDFSFSQVLIQVSFRALTQYWGVLVISALALLVSFVVGTYCYMALLAMHVIICWDTDHNLFWLGLMWTCTICSAIWTQRIIQDVLHVTTTGAVGTYWYSTYIPCEAVSSFKRAVGCSFGSIVKASIFIPLAEAAQLLTCFSRKRKPGAGGCCCHDAVANFARSSNRFAYTQIALYGLTFSRASMQGYDVFAQCHHCQILEHNITDSAVNISSLLGALMTMIAVGMPVYNAYVDEPLCPYSAALVVMAFTVGFISSKLVLRQLSASVNTTLTIYAQDNDVMAVNRPEVLERLEEAIMKRFPAADENENTDIMMLHTQEEA